MPGLQILQAPKTTGQSIAGALGSGLQRLASNRLQQIEQQNEQRQFAQSLLASGLDYTPQEAQFIAQLPLNERLKALQALPPAQGTRAAQPQPQAEFEQEPTITAAAEKQRAQELAPEQKEITQADINQMLQEQQQQQFKMPNVDQLSQAAQSLGFNVTPEKQQELQKKLADLQANPEAFNKLRNEYESGIAENKDIELRQPGFKGKAVPLGEAIQQSRRFATPTKPLSAYEKLKLEQTGRKEARDIESDARNETKKFRDEVNSARKSAKTKLRDLDRLDELENEKLETAGYKEFLERSGLDIPALMNPQSQEYEKISTSFIRDAGNIFKGKVSNYEADLMLKLIPTLSLSPEGRNRVRANLRYTEDAALAYGQTMDEVIKQNGGKIPLDLEERVLNRIDPKLDKLSKKFKENLKKPVPKGQSPITTAIQAGLGSALGAVGKSIPGLIGSAIKGAAQGAGQGLLK